MDRNRLNLKFCLSFENFPNIYRVFVIICTNFYILLKIRNGLKLETFMKLLETQNSYFSPFFSKKNTKTKIKIKF